MLLLCATIDKASALYMIPVRSQHSGMRSFTSFLLPLFPSFLPPYPSTSYELRSCSIGWLLEGRKESSYVHVELRKEEENDQDSSGKGEKKLVISAR